MFVICSILLTVNAGGVYIVSKEQIEGRLLKEENNNYLVDFSQGASNLGAIKPEVYKKYLVKKEECIKE